MGALSIIKRMMINCLKIVRIVIIPITIGMITITLLCSSVSSKEETRVSTDVNMDEETLIAEIGVLIRNSVAADSMDANRNIIHFIDRIRDNAAMLAVADSLVDQVLYNPMSPMRNEEMYIMFLREFLRCDSFPDNLRLREVENLRLVSQNRPGMIAHDFRFIDRDGVTATLHSLFTPEERSKLLLVFYDPDCTSCHKIISSLATDSKINSDIDNGTLRVLAVYTEGNRDIWERTKDDMPMNWRVVYDLSGIVENDLYDLPSMPSLYRLSSTGRVELKDSSILLESVWI